jgi:hypothetical protein
MKLKPPVHLNKYTKKQALFLKILYISTGALIGAIGAALMQKSCEDYDALIEGQKSQNVKITNILNNLQESVKNVVERTEQLVQKTK